MNSRKFSRASLLYSCLISKLFNKQVMQPSLIHCITVSTLKYWQIVSQQASYASYKQLVTGVYKSAKISRMIDCWGHSLFTSNDLLLKKARKKTFTSENVTCKLTFSNRSLSVLKSIFQNDHKLRLNTLKSINIYK